MSAPIPTHGSNNGKRRVVVTGIGAVTPLGLSARESWKNALEGKSGVERISLFDPKDCPVTFAAEVKGFDVTRAVGPYKPNPQDPAHVVTQGGNAKEARRVGRFCNLAISAGLEAYGDSGLDQIRDKFDPARFGVNIGVGMGGLGEIQATHDDYLAKGFRRISPFFILQSIPNMPSGQLSILVHAQGPNLCNVTACSSSAHSIGEAMKQIQRGDVEIMLAGGAEAVICELGVGGFAAMRALSTRNETPQTASRPFDRDRDGFVIGEGSAALILEEYEFARKRGARIYGELVGYGASGDAYHLTSPAPEQEGGRRAMAMAVKDAAIPLEEIGYINAHGTSTPAGDVEESRAVAQLFPNGKKHLHISSTKSMTGHLLGAAGALEAMFTILAVFEGKIPPTINLENLDPGCQELGLDFTANRAIDKKLNYALSNSFGFGGTNASIIVGKI
jgi:3-oxoacyl-[acyl-carrier-protein] synthase II